jgi:hypothetical protein
VLSLVCASGAVEHRLPLDNVLSCSLDVIRTLNYSCYSDCGLSLGCDSSVVLICTFFFAVLIVHPTSNYALITVH